MLSWQDCTFRTRGDAAMLAAVDMTTDRCHNNSQAPNSIAAARKSLAQLLDACDKSRVFAAGRRPFARIYRRLVAVLVRYLGSSIQTNSWSGCPRSQDSIVVLLRDSESRDEARPLLLRLPADLSACSHNAAACCVRAACAKPCGRWSGFRDVGCATTEERSKISKGPPTVMR